MLPLAALAVADRLIDTLMALARAVAAITPDRPAPPLCFDRAVLLFARLTSVIGTVMLIRRHGVRPKPERKPQLAAAAASSPDRATDGPTGAIGLPRHPGWLLDALPDLAPTLAADLATLLADPGATALLAAAPRLARALRPLLRSLGLPEPRSLPDPDPERPSPERDAHSAPTSDGAGVHNPLPANRPPERPFPPGLGRNARQGWISPRPSYPTHAQLVAIS